MQRLNLRTPKSFDYSSESESKNPRARFYCVSEGATEESYFMGIRNNKVDLDIKNDVFIQIVEKDEGQENFSHPEQLINACLVSMGRMDEDGNEIPQDRWKEHCKWDYRPETDVVCVIFDKDYRGLESKLENLFLLCEKHNIYVAISNPNFELWLLMHFPEIEKHDKEMLLNNPKNLRGEIVPNASKHKKYLEIALSKELPGYSKGSKIKFEQLMDEGGILLAIQQAELFCQEPKLLSNELGSTVGKLIKKMQDT